MSRLPHKQVTYSDFPWSKDITIRLSRSGYSFTHSIVMDMKFMKIWEVMKGQTTLWARVFRIRDAPTSYTSVMFPDGFRCDSYIKEDHVCDVVDVQVHDDFVFTFTFPGVMNMAKHKATQAGPPMDNDPRQQYTPYVQYWLPQVIAGLTNLHASGSYHGDLSLENIWIDRTNKMMVSGYSLLQGQDSDWTRCYWGPNFRYRPPPPPPPGDDGFEKKIQVKKKGGFGRFFKFGKQQDQIEPKIDVKVQDDWVIASPPREFDPDLCDMFAADVYALGVIMFELLTGEFLIPEAEPSDRLSQIQQENNYFDALRQALNDKSIEKKIKKHPEIPTTAQNLILLCLNPDQEQRIRLPFVADHDFFKLRLDERDEIAKGFYSAPSSTGIDVPKVNEELKARGIVIKAQLGKGSFGQVFRIRYKDEYFAMKAQHLAKENYQEFFDIEKEIMTTLKHKHLVQIIESFNLPNAGMFMYIMELAISDLKQQILALQEGAKVPIPLLEVRMKKWLLGAALGLQYLHSKLYAHCDFKPLNVIIRPNDESALIDFGLSLKFKSPNDTFNEPRGTVMYQSPQAMNSREPYSPFSTDIYAFGMTTLQCLMGFESAINVEDYVTTSRMSPEAKNLILGCLQREEIDRFGWRQIVGHKWFKLTLAETKEEFIIAQPRRGHSSEQFAMPNPHRQRRGRMPSTPSDPEDQPRGSDDSPQLPGFRRGFHFD